MTGSLIKQLLPKASSVFSLLGPMHKGSEHRHRLHHSKFQKPFKFNPLFSYRLHDVRRGVGFSAIEIPIDEGLLIRMDGKSCQQQGPGEAPDRSPPSKNGHVAPGRPPRSPTKRNCCETRRLLGTHGGRNTMSDTPETHTLMRRSQLKQG